MDITKALLTRVGFLLHKKGKKVEVWLLGERAQGLLIRQVLYSEPHPQPEMRHL